MGVQGQKQGQFSNVEDFKCGIKLIKLLFCSVAKEEPLVLKRKIWSRCIVRTLSTNLNCTLRKYYTVTTQTPIAAYELVEYLVNMYLMVFEKIYVIINVHFMVFKHDIFLCLQIICFAFCSDLKNENMRDSVQQGCKK